MIVVWSAPLICTRTPSPSASVGAPWREEPWEEPGFLAALLVEEPPVVQETLVPSLGWEDALEKGTTRSSTLAWRIPWTV